MREQFNKKKKLIKNYLFFLLNVKFVRFCWENFQLLDVQLVKGGKPMQVGGGQGDEEGERESESK